MEVAMARTIERSRSRMAPAISKENYSRAGEGWRRRRRVRHSSILLLCSAQPEELTMIDAGAAEQSKSVGLAERDRFFEVY